MSLSRGLKHSTSGLKLRKILASYRWRYIVALSIIALLVTSGFTAIQYLLSVQKQDSSIINIAGRQRMLSQKIAFYAWQYQLKLSQGLEESAANITDALNQSAKLMQNSHQLLTTSNVSVDLSPNIHTLYFEGDNSLDQRVKNFTQQAISLAQINTYSQLTTINFDVFSSQSVQALLTDLNQVVTEYEKEAHHRIQFLAKVEVIIWLVALLVLIIEVFMIFKPMENSIKTSFIDLLKARRRSERSQKIAQKALNIKDEFMANMSHEIRTPMNGVIGMLGLFLKSPLNPEQKHQANLAQSSAKSLLGIINEILDLSKIEENTLKLHQLEIDCQQLLEDCLAPLKFQAEEKGLTLNIKLANINHQIILADPTRIRQIFTNLISNSIKFTEQGEVAVNVELQEKNSHYFILAIEVSDTGIGIASEKIPTLFNSFSQADASSTKKYSGMGLGLHIVKRLVELMSGEISVTSQLGKGTCVRCNLPFQKIQANQQQTIDQNTTTDAESLVWPDSTKLLLVDDNIINQTVAQEILESVGLSVEVADNGQQVIDMLSNTPNAYDAILMDCQMPEMDGYEATAHIRQGSAGEVHKTTPILAMTANAMKGDKEKCLDAGMDDYIAKPIDTHILLHRLNKWVLQDNRLQ